MATNGIRLITPTSVDVTGAGSSATINAGGSVTFSTAATLSLNGVFSATYDNYIIEMQLRSNGSNADVYGRLRLSGSDASGSNYTVQVLNSNSTSVTGVRLTSQTSMIICTVDNVTERAGSTTYVYGPGLAQPTAFRSVNVRTASGAFISDDASTHSLSTAYDGITLTPSGGTLTGLVKVYGLVQ